MRQEAGPTSSLDTGVLPTKPNVVEYRDMIVIIRDRVQDLVKKGNRRYSVGNGLAISSLKRSS